MTVETMESYKLYKVEWRLGDGDLLSVEVGFEEALSLFRALEQAKDFWSIAVRETKMHRYTTGIKG